MPSSRTRVAVVSGLLLASLALAMLAAPRVIAAPPHAHEPLGSREQFRADMRTVWEDHIVWTRQYIVSAATQSENLPDIGPTAERLFANQSDIGSAIAPFYGDEAASSLTKLLTEHISIAANVIAAAKAGDDLDAASAVDRWYVNADEIATFLARANPSSWPQEEMTVMMRGHLDHTLAEALARLRGDYVADIAAYDLVHEQILHMADMLSNGIIQQFPARFAK